MKADIFERYWRLRVRCIPSKDIALIRRGCYCSYGDRDREGFVPYRKMNRYIDTCLHLIYWPHQEMNIQPLGVTFLAMYDIITKRK